MTPVDVTGPGTDEPVKVHHDGGGTHGAGGGGSGGGVVDQQGKDGSAKESQGADIVDGKPRDATLDVPHRAHSALSSISHTHSRSGSEGTGKPRPTSPSPPGTANSKATASSSTQKDGKTPQDAQAGLASSAGEPGEYKASGPNEAFAEWERQDMEELLGELRGHLGEFLHTLHARIVQPKAETKVVYPTRFLEAEDAANNFLFNVSWSSGSGC